MSIDLYANAKNICCAKNLVYKDSAKTAEEI